MPEIAQSFRAVRDVKHQGRARRGAFLSLLTVADAAHSGDHQEEVLVWIRP